MSSVLFIDTSRNIINSLRFKQVSVQTLAIKSYLVQTLKNMHQDEEEIVGFYQSHPKYTEELEKSLENPSARRQRKERACFLQTDLLLRLSSRFVYGLLPCWPQTVNCFTVIVSVLFALLQLAALCEYIYCIKTYWLVGSNPHIPIVTMVIELSLFISGCVSFILACRFFYGNSHDFQRSSCEVIPYVKFQLEECLEKDCGPEPFDWLLCNICLCLGILDVAFIIVVDMCFNAYFDFWGIHNFSYNISPAAKVVYHAYIGIFVWGLMCAVVSCCIFFILTRDIARHVDVTEMYILEKARSYSEAKACHEYLLHYSDVMIKKFEKWFTTHNVFFFFIMMCMILKWFLITGNDSRLDKHPILWASQLLASFLIAFKFSFPFLSASRTTARFKQMYYNINQKKVFLDIFEMPRFLEYAERCNFGFVVFGVKITTNLAFLTIVTTFIGIFKCLST